MPENIVQNVPEQVSGIKRFFASMTLEKFLPALVTFLIGLVVIKLLMALVSRSLERSKLEKAAHSLVKSLVRVVLYAVLFMIVVSGLGVDVTSVVALASVASLAVSLAMQTALSNIVGGMTLLTNHPFKSGDFVEIAGQSGTVQEVGIAYTKLATADNKIVSLPNSAVVATQIVNYSVTGLRRLDIEVSASYDAPVDKVMSVLLEAAKIPEVKQDPAPFAGVTNYGDSAIGYVLRFWVSTEDYWDAKFKVNASLQPLFAENDIEMTYPHLNVHLDPK